MSGVRPGAIVLDVNDLAGQARFWAGLTGLDSGGPPPAARADWCDVGRLGQGGPMLSLQLVPESKTVKNRLHLDWLVDDFDAARRRALALGARERSGRHGQDSPWQVFADPEGNEFCLCSA
jgi:Glyoxalase-like domain